MTEDQEPRRLPAQHPPFLYIPCLDHVTDAGQAQALHRETKDGRTALLVYSARDRLRTCCGDDQPWFGLPTQNLQMLHDVRPFDIVCTDMYVPTERRARRRAGLGTAAKSFDETASTRPAAGGTGMAA